MACVVAWRLLINGNAATSWLNRSDISGRRRVMGTAFSAPSQIRSQMRAFVWKPHGYMIVFGKGKGKPREMIVTWFWKLLSIPACECSTSQLKVEGLRMSWLPCACARQARVAGERVNFQRMAARERFASQRLWGAPNTLQVSETTLSNLWQNLLNSWGFRMRLHALCRFSRSKFIMFSLLTTTCWGFWHEFNVKGSGVMMWRLRLGSWEVGFARIWNHFIMLFVDVWHCQALSEIYDCRVMASTVQISFMISS